MRGVLTDHFVWLNPGLSVELTRVACP